MFVRCAENSSRPLAASAAASRDGRAGRSVEYAVARSSVEDVDHLVVGERIVRLHRGMTRDGRGDPLQCFLDARAAVEPLEILRQGAHAAAADSASSSAGMAHTRTASPPNSSTSNPSRSRSAACVTSAWRPSGVRSSSSGCSRRWTLEPSGRQPLHRPLEQHALVGDVLVDDRDAFVVDRDDEGVAELAEGDHRPDGRRSTPSGLRAPGSGLRGLSGPGHRRPGAETPPGGLEPGPGSRHRLGNSRPRAPRERHVWPGTPASSEGGVSTQRRGGTAAERVTERAAHELVNQRPLAETDLRLARVHVHVHRIERHLDEQVHLGAAFLDRRHAVGVDDGMGNRLVAHHAAVDEDVLRPARGPLSASPAA